jgi:hypothetical protein
VSKEGNIHFSFSLPPITFFTAAPTNPLVAIFEYRVKANTGHDKPRYEKKKTKTQQVQSHANVLHHAGIKSHKSLTFVLP